MPELTNKLDRTMTSVNELSTSATSAVRNYDRLATNLQAPGGPIERAAGAIASLEGVTSDLEMRTLPHVTQMTDEARISLRAVRRTVTNLGDRPQSILFGGPKAQPGPGEPGFVPPTK
jgi:phospholipid/cholesterol/gamma-HCH transport system substrate-binding protein